MPGNNYTRADLYVLIKDIFQVTAVPPLISKQVNGYILDYNMSFKEIARCLVYWLEVRHQTFDIKYGIGIVPNIREEAAKYFRELEKQKEQQQQNAEKAVEFENNNIIFNIQTVQSHKRKLQQLDLNEIDLGDGDADSTN